MVRVILALCLMAFLSSSGQCGTIKKKRDSGAMATDYVNDEYMYNDDYVAANEITGFYDVKYDKKFNSEWLDPESRQFDREARKVGNALKREIAQEFNLVDADVTVIVDNFIPGSTRAQVRISISDYYGITLDDLTAKMNRLVDANFRIGRAALLEVADLNTPIASPEITGIIFELTYQGDNRAKEVALNDTRSRDFEVLSTRLASQVELLLVEPLQTISQMEISPQMMQTTVLRIVPEGSLTKAEIELHVDGVPVEDISRALLTLTDSDNKDIRIDGGLVIGLDELDRVAAPVPDDGSGAIYNPENYGYEPDFGMIEGEVMAPKEVPGADSSAPPTSNGAEPTPPPLTTESSTTTTTSTASVAPVFRGEPTPPGNCDPEGASKPRHGTVSCTFENEIGSTCQFTCNPDTQMVGTDTIQCGFDGIWNEDPPYCNRLHCQPPMHLIGNGSVACSNGNRFRSSCDFTCDEGFRLLGDETITCPRSEEWTNDPPICEMIPVNCEEEYGEWSECAAGTRKRAEVIVARGSVSIVCPALTEDCADCELEWGDWTECVDGARSRSEYIKQKRIGAGEECSTPDVQRQECKQCEVQWADWSVCENEARTRSQVITVEAVGYECPELQSETQECLPCVVEMGEWGSCEDDITVRREIIIQQPTNGGRPCPVTLRREEQACKNCEVGWTEWGKCTNGVTRRSNVITVQPQGVGAECPELETEEAECADCVVEWSDWGACTNGVAERYEQVTQPRVGEGKLCPELRTQNEKCTDCEVQWGDWGSCIGGLSRRAQFVFVEKEGVGAECPRLEEEYRSCAECRMEWQEWSECDGAVRRRTQRISQKAINVEEPCPEIQEEVEPCSDCTYEWSEWGDCDFGVSTRRMIISSEATGAGKNCPANRTETKDCCFLVWAAWSDCKDGIRMRMEEVISQPTGETCRDPEVEEEDCTDCVVDWGEWSACVGGVARRSQVITQPAMGGKACPELDEETQPCEDCVLEWAPWRECSQGERTRQERVVSEASGRGTECPAIMQVETEDCNHCQSEWGEWGECSGGQRVRNLVILQEQVGAGDACPSQQTEFEDCVDCEVQWSAWSFCQSGERTRQQIVRIQPVGAGQQCEELGVEVEDCVDCEVEWGPWSECSGNSRTRTQVIRVDQVGAGKSCPFLRTDSEACIDCVVEWEPWTACFGGTQRRQQYVKTAQLGAGEACPTELLSEERDCAGSPAHFEKLVCRFVHTVLGYQRRPTMRDLLLIADESGSIGWMNFEKIKLNFKSIAKNIRGGIGSQETQIAMTSFALFGRTLFDFDDHHNYADVVSAIDKTYFKGGYRSRIGDALEDANTWLFQQASGMRSFPDVDDNIEHEILIATDGCRTQDIYHLKQGLEIIKKRGIKLYVLGIATRDERCRKTIELMVEDESNLFMLGSWAELDEMSQRIDDGVCQTVSSQDTSESTTTTQASSEDGDEGSGAIPSGSRGDSAGQFQARAKREIEATHMLGDFE